MSLSRRTFYRVRCDGLGNNVACPSVLTDGEHNWWDEESIEAWLVESEWIEWTTDSGVQHYCFDHWTFCDVCEERTPLRHLGEFDGERACERCGMELVAQAVKGEGG